MEWATLAAVADSGNRALADWLATAISFVALGVSIWAIIEARMSGKYTVKKDAAEKRTALLNQIREIELQLNFGRLWLFRLLDPKINEPDRIKGNYLSKQIDSLYAELEDCRNAMCKAPTAVELARVEQALNELEAYAKANVDAVEKLFKPKLATKWAGDKPTPPTPPGWTDDED